MIRAVVAFSLEFDARAARKTAAGLPRKKNKNRIWGSNRSRPVRSGSTLEVELEVTQRAPHSGQIFSPEVSSLATGVLQFGQTGRFAVMNGVGCWAAIVSEC
jgi:hypothetical protein